MEKPFKITAARSPEVTPVVIGLTVVAFGTSSPEFMVSLISSSPPFKARA